MQSEFTEEERVRVLNGARDYHGMIVVYRIVTSKKRNNIVDAVLIGGGLSVDLIDLRPLLTGVIIEGMDVIIPFLRGTTVKRVELSPCDAPEEVIMKIPVNQFIAKGRTLTLQLRNPVITIGI